MMRKAIRDICDDVDRMGGTNVLMSLFTRYDETPMRLCVVDSEAMWRLPTPHGADAQGVMATFQSAITTDRDSAVTKLLQTEYIVSVLVSVRGEFYNFTFRPMVPIQSLGRTTGEVYVKCLRETEKALGLHEFVPRFKRFQRCSCTDGDSAIAKAERTIERPLEDSQATLRTLCRVHRVSSIRESTCNLDTKLVSNLRRCVLSLMFGNSLKTFRDAVRVVLSKRLKIVRGEPPRSVHRVRNERALSHCMPRTAGNEWRRGLILSLLPGDWTNPKEICSFPDDDESDEERIRKIMVDLVQILVAQGPRSFPSRNWVRCELAPEWLLTLELPHRLFSQSFPVYVKMLAGTFDPTADLDEQPEYVEIGDGIAGGDQDAAEQEDEDSPFVCHCLRSPCV